ncbi:MAG TPA: hypothetical protein VK395_35470 [Gemmataceae bacterium]|nr:hypothetical protein [Gemmataceae bacterium]
MAEPFTYPEQHVSEPVVYRRISGFAIAGFVLTVIYILSLGVASFASFRSRAPLLLSYWAQAVPLIAAILSMVGLVLIRRSQGILAGAALAMTGLWLSVLFGLGYTAYFVATRFAIINQANQFTLKWFDKLKDGKFGPAFMDTRDPSYRQRVNPDDEAAISSQFPGALGAPREAGPRKTVDMFREMQIPRILGQGGKDVRVETKGVMEWEYKNGRYAVQRAYVVDTLEGTFNLEVTAICSDSQQRDTGREWMIEIAPAKTVLKPGVQTELGKQIQEFIRPSGAFIQNWIINLRRGQAESAYLDTREASERDNLRAELIALGLSNLLARSSAVGSPCAALANGAVLRAQRELVDRSRLPDYQKFRNGEMLNADKFEVDIDPTREIVLTAMRQLFSGGTSGDNQLAGLAVRGSHVRFWSIANDRLRIPHEFTLLLDLPDNRRYEVGLVITVESNRKSTPEGEVTVWRIVNVELANAAVYKPPNPQQQTRHLRQ